MNVQKLVFNKLFKEELSIEKVELGILQDLTSNINQGVATGDKARKQFEVADAQSKVKSDLINKLEKATSDLEKEIQSLQFFAEDTKAYLARASKDYTAFVNQASDLGIDYPKSIDTNYKILEKQVQFLNNSIPKFK